MASQRITLARIGGVAADTIWQRLKNWESMKQVQPLGDAPASDGSLDEEIAAFLSSLQNHAAEPPVIYFAEWIDTWSMFNLFTGTKMPWLQVESGDLTVFGYFLPDHGELSEYLKDKTGRQWEEEVWLLYRLREAENVWNIPDFRSVIVLVREVLGGSVSDKDYEDSFRSLPDWLLES